jgi:hypothetical protein
MLPHNHHSVRLILAACPSPMQKPTKWRAPCVKMGEEERETRGSRGFFHAERDLYGLHFTSCWKMMLIGGTDFHSNSDSLKKFELYETWIHIFSSL